MLIKQGAISDDRARDVLMGQEAIGDIARR